MQVLKLADSSSAALPYFVHYVGWNSRHDQWISRDVIAGLAAATPARPARTPKSLTKVEKFMISVIDEFLLCSIMLLVSVQWSTVLHMLT